MKAKLGMAVITLAARTGAPPSFSADDEHGVFETILVSSVSFDETNAVLADALSSISGTRATGQARRTWASPSRIADSIETRRTGSIVPEA